jgi:hypothetical protein
MPDGTGDVPTIQAGVDSAAAGDTLLLASGTFTGPGNYAVLLPDKSIVLRSETGNPEDCIIDCEGHLGSGRYGFHIVGWVDDREIAGVTVRNGNVNGSGGAVYCEGSVTIRDCAFAANQCGWDGGAIYRTYGPYETYVKHCAFTSNEAGHWGGAILVEGVWVEMYIDSCTFYDNHAVTGGAICCYQHEALAFIENSVFHHNSASEDGGAVAVLNMSTEIDNCTFVANSAPVGSGIASYTSGMLVRKGIIAYGIGGCGYHHGWEMWDPSPYCTDIFGNEGGDWVGPLASQLGVGGNFSACPAFCNALTEPYNLGLCDSSPCLPGNHPDGVGCDLIGALGQSCECGPTDAQQSTWGAIKLMYR